VSSVRATKGKRAAIPPEKPDAEDARSALAIALAARKDPHWVRARRAPVSTPPDLREATLRYLETSGSHDETEDIHPSRLDDAEAELHDALERRSSPKEP
jgi:hypothetical protein